MSLNSPQNVAAVSLLLIDAEGRCPPEDCGGPWGYADLLEVLTDPNPERHAEMAEWVDTPLDPASPAINLHQKRRRGPGAEMGTKASRQEEAGQVIRSPHRMVTVMRHPPEIFCLLVALAATSVG